MMCFSLFSTNWQICIFKKSEVLATMRSGGFLTEKCRKNFEVQIIIIFLKTSN